MTAIAWDNIDTWPKSHFGKNILTKVADYLRLSSKIAFIQV